MTLPWGAFLDLCITIASAMPRIDMQLIVLGELLVQYGLC